MSVTKDGPTLEELATKLAELECVNAQMREELDALHTTNGRQVQEKVQASSLEPQGSSKKPMMSRHRRSRRGLLRKGLGAAVATVGAGALFGMSEGTALANGTEGPTTFKNNGGTVPAVTANSTSPSGSKVSAIKGTSSGYTGIAGITTFSSFGSAGIYGQGPNVGVSGQVQGASTTPTSKVAVYGTGSNGSGLGGIGVQGQSDTNTGVLGQSTSGNGVVGQNTGSSGYGVFGGGPRGILGKSTSDIGVLGESDTYVGIWGQGNISGGTGVVGSAPGATTLSPGNTGVFGTGSNGSSNGGVGVSGESDTSYGVLGISSGTLSTSGAAVAGFTSNLSDTLAVGVQADGASGYGVYSTCDGSDGYGIYGEGDTVGVSAYSVNGTGVVANAPTQAGEFYGNLDVTGTLTKGGGSFKIDHPLDPANKYLSHSFVESPDMKNVYDGVVTLDANGQAVVDLPAWFDVINSDFRYQLTCIGGYAPVYVSQEVQGNRFKIAGGMTGMKVSWLVTGIRQDAWAKAHRIPIEEEKAAKERGYYLHPELYGYSSDKSILEARYGAKLHHGAKLHRPKK